MFVLYYIRFEIQAACPQGIHFCIARWVELAFADLLVLNS